MFLFFNAINMNSAKKARNPCFSLTAFPMQKISGTHEHYMIFFLNQTAANCVLIKTRPQPRKQMGSAWIEGAKAAIGRFINVVLFLQFRFIQESCYEQQSSLSYCKRSISFSFSFLINMISRLIYAYLD